jgi:hypothetical protein
VRAVFADPKTDFIFVRVFGSEPRKHLLIELLNTLLELKGDRRIHDLTYLPSEQRVPLPEMKLSIVDVKCIDERGREYLVQVQLSNVEGFDERFLSRVTGSLRTPQEASTAFAVQLRSSEDCPDADIVDVTICDFELWPAEAGVPSVPMLSRWRVQEPGVFPSRSSQEDYPGANGLWGVKNGRAGHAGCSGAGPRERPETLRLPEILHTENCVTELSAAEVSPHRSYRPHSTLFVLFRQESMGDEIGHYGVEDIPGGRYGRLSLGHRDRLRKAVVSSLPTAGVLE